MAEIVPVVVTTGVKCWCGYATDETYEFEMSADKVQSMEADEPGGCPKCGAPVNIYLRGTKILH